MKLISGAISPHCLVLTVFLILATVTALPFLFSSYGHGDCLRKKVILDGGAGGGTRPKHGQQSREFLDPASVGEVSAASLDRTSSLPIVPDTFLYMSMAAGEPSAYAKRRACFPKSALIFLTFKTRIRLTNTPGCNRSTVYFPRSTWSTGRNELLRQALITETKHGWRYEFFVFTDNDVGLISKTGVRGEDGEELFRQLLRQYRPVRAGVRFYDIPVKPLNRERKECARTAYTDACVDAFHRTGVSLLLPYIFVLDEMSWYMSAYIVNLLAAALIPDHCHVYRQVGVNKTKLEHGQYPRGSLKWDYGYDWVTTRNLVNWLLVHSKVPGFRVSEPLAPKIKAGLFGRIISGKEEECRAQPVGVDYGKLAKYRIR